MRYPTGTPRGLRLVLFHGIDETILQGRPNKNIPHVLLGTRLKVRFLIAKPDPMGSWDIFIGPLFRKKAKSDFLRHDNLLHNDKIMS
jgi:hypothetical protein